MSRLRRCTRSARDDQAGASLVELLAVIAVASVIGVAITTFVVGVNHSGRFAQSTSFVLDDARRAAERIQRETRQAVRVEPTSTPLSMVLTVDVDGDGVPEAVTYTVVAGQGELRRSVNGGPEQVLARGISATAAAFEYRPTLPGANEVRITLALQPSDAGGGAPQTVALAVRIRNVQ